MVVSCPEVGDGGARSMTEEGDAGGIFVIEAAEAEAMARRSGITVLQLLPTLVPAAQALARPPISRYCVGAAGLGSSGRVYLGVNLEFRGVPLNQSVHAEQFLIANAAGRGERRISHIAVSAVPCGHCRQFLQEVRDASEIQILVTSDGPGAEFQPLSKLIPHPFGPRDLLHEDCPLLMEPRDSNLVLVEEASGGKHELAACNGRASLEAKLRAAALEGARIAHAPYSGCPSGFAVADEEGRVYGGGYAESAAYNPSLGPVQAALIAYVARSGRRSDRGEDGGYDKIVGAALVEEEGAVVSHEETARMLMAAVAPRCRLVVYRCRAG